MELEPLSEQDEQDESPGKRPPGREEVDWEKEASEEGEDMKLEPLSEKQLNEVSLAVEAFGMHVVWVTNV